MHDIDQAALDAAEAIMRGPKHINPVREKARIQLIIIDAMKQLNTRHAPEGWCLVPTDLTEAMMAAYRESSIAPIGPISVHGYWALLAAAPKWGGE